MSYDVSAFTISTPDDTSVSKDVQSQINGGAKKSTKVNSITSEARTTFAPKETNEKGILDDTEDVLRVKQDDRITSDTISLYELTEAINIRAAQIDKTQCYYCSKDAFDKCKSSHDVAEQEVLEHKTPLLLLRVVGTVCVADDAEVCGYSVKKIIEEWTVREMQLPPDWIPNVLRPIDDQLVS